MLEEKQHVRQGEMCPNTGCCEALEEKAAPNKSTEDRYSNSQDD